MNVEEHRDYFDRRMGEVRAEIADLHQGFAALGSAMLQGLEALRAETKKDLIPMTDNSRKLVLAAAALLSVSQANAAKADKLLTLKTAEATGLSDQLAASDADVANAIEMLSQAADSHKETGRALDLFLAPFAPTDTDVSKLLGGADVAKTQAGTVSVELQPGTVVETEPVKREGAVLTNAFDVAAGANQLHASIDSGALVLGDSIEATGFDTGTTIADFDEKTGLLTLSKPTSFDVAAGAKLTVTPPAA